MKKLLVVIFGLMLCVGAKAMSYDVVPLPQSIQMQKGEPFLLNNQVQILASESLQTEAAFLQSYLKELTGLELALSQKREKKVSYIELAISPNTAAEGYLLTVSKKGISVVGGSSAGVFYGIQTIRKAIAENGDASAIEFPAVVITDSPRFSWRGMHLDCSRHFFSVEFVKKFIDLLALHNMNTFHWHLTDDQGWRLEIKKYPKLTTIGSQRSGTVLGTNSDLDDGIPHGGFYTQQEARDIVKYAAERHITVVPEIDMPGHMLAALACYPELGCTGGPYQVGHYWGVYTDVLCVGNPKVYEFVEGVLGEIMDIFPSEVIHIGGDETPTVKWQQCPKCQALSKKLGSTVTSDEEFSPLTSKLSPLQAHFTKRVFAFLTSNHRRALGWDEILDGSPQDAMIMSWRGTAPGAQAAELGHDVVMSPTTYCYFDYLQSEERIFEPSRCDGFIPVEKVYALDPAPDSISVEARQHILGVQANIWTEYIFTEGMVEYQALPRMSALAEVAWTNQEVRNYDAFVNRLTRFSSLYEFYRYQYAKHLWPERQLPNRWQF